MTLSRRNILALAGAAAVGKAMAQAPTPSDAKPDPLATAREDNRKSAESLNQFAIPMSTEPSFVFKA